MRRSSIRRQPEIRGAGDDVGVVARAMAMAMAMAQAQTEFSDICMRSHGR